MANKNYLFARKLTRPVPLIAGFKLSIAGLVMSIQNGLLAVFRKLLFKKKISTGYILIYRTGSIGDSLCAVPAIKAIAANYPEAKLDILTNAGRANLAGLQYLLQKKNYNELIDYLGFSGTALYRKLKDRKYDMVIQLPQVDATFLRLLRDLFFFRTIASNGFGWRVSQSTLFRKTQAKHLQFYPEPTRLMFLLKQQGLSIHEDIVRLQPVQDDREIALKILREIGINTGDKVIAVVVGAKRPQNRWPIGSFKKVTEHFAGSYKLLLIGSQDDNGLITPLLNNSSVKNACGRLTPLQSAAAMQICQLTLSNDTGPMHLSYAVGTPTIALFSSRDLPGKWYPPETEFNYVFRTSDVACQACFSETCTNNICMQAIAADDVIAQMEKILMAVSHK